MRTFIAIDFSTSIKDRIAQMLLDLRSVPTKVKWVEPHHVHCTLKFLGPTPEEKRKAIQGALRSAIQGPGGIAPFVISLEGVGAFPSLERPHVLWIGVKDGAAQVKALAKVVDQALAPFGVESEKREFTPHATIGRVKEMSVMSMLSPHFGAKFGQCEVKMLTWYQSTLHPQGPVYDVLEMIPLL